MTVIDSNLVGHGHADRSAGQWMPSVSELRSTVFKGIGLAAVTFVLGAITTAVLREPVETRLIPAVIEHVREPLRLNLYAQNADGALHLDGCYKLMTLPWSGYGQMVEIVDPKECSAAPTGPDEDLTPNTFKMRWNVNGGVMSFEYNHFENEFGGGVFTGDALATPGIYIGSLAGQSHVKAGAPCKLTHYWAVVGNKNRDGVFEKLLATRITGKDGKMAMLPSTLENAGPSCTAEKAKT